MFKGIRRLRKLSGFGIKDSGATKFASKTSSNSHIRQAENLDMKSEWVPAGLTKALRKLTQELSVPETQKRQLCEPVEVHYQPKHAEENRQSQSRVHISTPSSGTNRLQPPPPLRHTDSRHSNKSVSICCL